MCVELASMPTTRRTLVPFSMSHPTDFDSLIRDAVNQDNGALETLLLWHYEDLAGYIERKSTARDRRRFDPEDVIQHAHRSVFLNINSFHGTTENEFVKWLFVCAANALRDIRRHYNSSKRSGYRNHVRLDSVGMTSDVLQLAMHDPTPSQHAICLLYTSPSPRDATLSRMPSSA